MTSPDSRTPAGRVLRSIPGIARALAAEIRRAGGDEQLTMPQFSALRLLADHDCSVGEMAKTLHVSMPTVTQSVDNLVSKGLAERSVGDPDRRQVRLHITPEGRRVLRAVLHDVEAWVEEVLADLPEDVRLNLAEGLERMLALVRRVRETERV